MGKYEDEKYSGQYQKTREGGSLSSKGFIETDEGYDARRKAHNDALRDAAREEEKERRNKEREWEREKTDNSDQSDSSRESTPWSWSKSDITICVGLAIGAIVGAMQGFAAGGVGGVITGLIVGPIVAGLIMFCISFVFMFVWEVTINVLPFVIIILIIGGLIAIIQSLWGVGKSKSEVPVNYAPIKTNRPETKYFDFRTGEIKSQSGQDELRNYADVKVNKQNNSSGYEEAMREAVVNYYSKSELSTYYRITKIDKIRVEDYGPNRIAVHVRYEYSSIPGNRMGYTDSGYDQRIFITDKSKGKPVVIEMKGNMSAKF